MCLEIFNKFCSLFPSICRNVVNIVWYSSFLSRGTNLFVLDSIIYLPSSCLDVLEELVVDGVVLAVCLMAFIGLKICNAYLSI